MPSQNFFQAAMPDTQEMTQHGAGPGGEPAPGTVPQAGTGPGLLRCWIPEDMLTIRRTNPALARRWRLAVREVLGGAVDGGYQVTAVLRSGWYVLEQGRP
jgi:predicted GNAT superfamily acetyltransferase